MRVSLEWISDYVDLPADFSAKELAHQLTLKTVEVEDVIDTDGDIVLEIDNKSLTNRPDLWGHYGIARELATIYGLPLRPLSSAPSPSHVDDLIGRIDAALCRRLAVVDFGVPGEPGESPEWLRKRLARIGENSVSLLVDLSNYVMFTVGQPNHIYDADRITGPLSVIRTRKVVKVDLLSGRQELPAGTPVVADSSGPVGVAGIMGGSDSAVTESSLRFMLEVASFDPQPVRKASQQLGIRSEASARFEKGLDTQRVDAAIGLFLDLLSRLVPSAEVNAMQDKLLEPTEPSHVDVDLGFLNARIGEEFNVPQVEQTLGSLGFSVDADGDRLRVTAPSWRSTGDISLPHDIVEEVARIHGYDNIPVAPLTVALNPVRRLNRRPLDRVMREQLASRGGMQEVVTYPWVSDQLLAATGFAKDQTVQFDGAPAPDLNSLRPSLVPGLLESVAANQRYQQSFRLFEAGNVFAPGSPVPEQTLMLAGVLVGADGAELFRQAKGILEMLRKHCHLTELSFGDAAWPVWADTSTRTGFTGGILALVSKRCLRVAGIESAQVACFDIHLTRVAAHTSRDNRYESVPELPEADFDLSVVVADQVSWSAVESVALQSNLLVHRIEYVGEFRGGWVPDGHRSLSLRLTLRPQGTTLTAEVIGAARTDALAALEQQLGARLR